MKVRFALLLTALPLLAGGSLRAETVEHWIAKARAYLGSESALNAVTSVHFTGTVEAVEKIPSAEDKTKLVDHPISLPADLVFQKPFQYRITLTRPGSVETTALDGYDGWKKTTNLETKRWQLSLLAAPQIKHLRANTWQNLHYYAGLEKEGGKVQLGADTVVDGVNCVLLSFIHDDDIIFRRYFEKATGRLVKTETESGGEIREEGAMIVNGIRFPKKVINTTPNHEVTTITIDKVVLNEPVAAGEFAVPSFQAN